MQAEILYAVYFTRPCCFCLIAEIGCVHICLLETCFGNIRALKKPLSATAADTAHKEQYPCTSK